MSTLSPERVILSGLVFNEDFSSRALPYVKSEYFIDVGERAVFDIVSEFSEKYKALPSKVAIGVELTKRTGMNEAAHRSAQEVIDSLSYEGHETEWLVDLAEKFCKDRALHIALSKALSVFDTSDSKRTLPEAIPDLLSQALAVTFDNSVGHDYVADQETRMLDYQKVEHKISFDIDLLNKITKNGIIKKSLLVLMAATGVGKSLMMCHMAAHNLRDGKNVLYVTLEMPEEQVARRIDANLLDINIGDFDTIDPRVIKSRFESVKSKLLGNLIIKEYPTGSASASNIRALLGELKRKRDFAPDIIYIDYINIMSSARVKGDANSYTIIKSIAEEIRGLGMEFDCAMVTATQFNRTGLTTSDPDLTNTSESIGLPYTADLMLAMYHGQDGVIPNDQIFFKQLKNRYNDTNYYNKFLVGIDKSKMRLFNLETSAQTRFDAGAKDPDKPTFVTPSALDVLKRMTGKGFN